MKRILIVLIVIVAAVAGTMYFRRQAAADPMTYLFVPISKGHIESTVAATGNLSAVDSVQVGTQVSGRITALYADFNDHVQKGQLLARLDTTVLRLSVDRAEASTTQGLASLRQAKFALDQTQRLLETKAATQTDYESAAASFAVAQANLKSDSVQLKEAIQNLEYATIYAPISGIVIKRSVDVGQTVAASFSAPELFLIAGDLKELQMLAMVDESDIGKIKKGQDVSFTVEAFPNRTFHGQVQQVRLQSTVSDNVVMYPVLVEVENPDGSLLPGMTATANFLVAQAKDVFKVPTGALRFQPTQEMIAQFRKETGGSADSGAARGARGGAEGRGGGNAGARGGFGAPGGGFGAAAARPTNEAALWYVKKDGSLAVMHVHTGLTDGQFTEVSGEGLQDGMQVIGAVTGGSAAGASVQNPFSGNSDRGRGGFRRGGF